jgi:hypothetical protein
MKNQTKSIEDFYLPVLNIFEESGGIAQLDDMY